jgi:hypothetical protein
MGLEVYVVMVRCKNYIDYSSRQIVLPWDRWASMWPLKNWSGFFSLVQKQYKKKKNTPWFI